MSHSTQLALVIAAVVTAGCNPKAARPSPFETIPDPHAAQQHVLKTYQVPPERETSIKRLLEETRYPVFTAGEDGAQTSFMRLRPQFTGEGYFALSAPQSIHTGVQGLIDVVARTEPPPDPPSVRVTYWLVLGWPASEAQIGPQLQEVSGALEALGKLGPMRFELLERLSLASLADVRANTRGRMTTITHTVSPNNDVIELRLEIHVQQPGERALVETTLNVKPGQFAVLGHAGYLPPGHNHQANEPTPTLFYVARAETLD